MIEFPSGGGTTADDEDEQANSSGPEEEEDQNSEKEAEPETVEETDREPEEGDEPVSAETAERDSGEGAEHELDQRDGSELGQDSDRNAEQDSEREAERDIELFSPDADESDDESSDERDEPNDQNFDPNRGPGEVPLAEELGVLDLVNPIFGGRGRLFAAAGPKNPIVEFGSDFVIMHPPQKPFSDEGITEDIVNRVDKRGVLLDELGQPKRISGARYNGQSLWFSGEQKEDSTKHFCIWFDAEGEAHKLYVGEEAVTTDIIYRLRARTHDGELNIFPDLTSD